MNANSAGTLSVLGATIYYERTGSGPLVLCIPGGAQDAGVFADLARHLHDRFTVISFDPRGNSRTVVDQPPSTLDVDTIADDAAALIRANSDEPAFVFGTSGGAHVGLSLAARHPTLVRMLIAHEPPTMMLLPDPEVALTDDRALYATYREHGVEAAMQRFFAENGLMQDSGGPPAMHNAEDEATFMRISGNFEYWLAHGMLSLSTYRPDVDTLKNGTPQIVVAIGELSVEQPIATMARALADGLGMPPVTVPGDHMGFATDAERFAQRIEVVFGGSTSDEL